MRGNPAPRAPRCQGIGPRIKRRKNRITCLRRWRRKDKCMKIKMIPGEYNAELAEKIKALAADFDSANSDEFDAMEVLGDLQEEYGRDALMDGLYYACAARDAKLADQELYFDDQLYGDEFPSFVGRFFCS